MKTSITEEGVYEPRVLWGIKFVDGYNRYEIAQKHSLKYITIENTNLANREGVIQWIVKTQLGRRNLTAKEASYYRGKLYESLKKSHGGDRKSSGQNDHLKTAEEIAEQQGVSDKTVRRDAKFSGAVDKIGELLGEDAKYSILSGEADVLKKDIEKISEIAEEDPESAKQVI